MTARPRVLLSTAAVAALFGLAAPALALASTPAAAPSAAESTGLGSADGVRYKKATVQIPGNDLGNATDRFLRTHCDTGWKALSGGQTIAVKSPHAIADSAVEDGEKSFYASAWQADELPAKLTAYAICVKTTRLTTAAVPELNVPGNSQVTDTAWCENGHAVGGGLNVVGEKSDFALNSTSPVDSAADADTRPDDGWRAYTHYYGPGNSGKGAIISVQCLGGSAPAYRTRTATVPVGKARYATARCPKGKTVLGGGVYVDGAAISSHVVASRPWDGGDAGRVPEDGWRAGLVSHASNDLTMTVHAICR